MSLPSSSLSRASSRRSFLRFTVAGAALSGLSSVFPALAQNHNVPANSEAGGGASLGTGDIAVLNYAYALEQLEAEFYRIILSRPYGGMNAAERQILTEIGGHEKAHVDFLRGALGGNAIQKLELNFSSINFADRMNVLTNAHTFEDTGVAAYNGAGQLLQDPGHLNAAGRIVSVEARHAAILRDLLGPRSSAFAGDDVVDKFGLGAVEKPATVLKTVAPFIVTQLNTSGLPKS